MSARGPESSSTSTSKSSRGSSGALGIKHLRSRPYRPQTNGKAERFIGTMINGWAYAAIYRNSRERTAALPGWLEHYNFRRRHAALGHKPPAARLSELNNVFGPYT